MLDIKELYWLAGILDGEGSFVINKKLSANNSTINPRISIVMADSDTIYRVAKIMGGKQKVGVVDRSPKFRKLLYSYYVNGGLAIEWMMTLYGLMSNRRQERIREILDLWREQGFVHSAVVKLRSTCINGHPWTPETTYFNNGVDGTKCCRICKSLRVGFSYNFVSLSKEYPTLTPTQLKEKFIELRTQEIDKPRVTCKRGHPWTPETTYLNNGKRSCGICGKLRAKFNREFSVFSGEYPTLTYKQLKEKFYEIIDKQELN